MAVARPLSHDQRLKAILDGGEHGVRMASQIGDKKIAN